MSVCVLDGSAALAWVLPEETSPALETLLGRVRRGGAVVPSLWQLEVTNVLVLSERRKRITRPQRTAALALLATLSLNIDTETNPDVWTQILDLTDQHNLTVYDASYLELALRRQLPLASLDKALMGAARECNVPLLP